MFRSDHYHTGNSWGASNGRYGPPGEAAYSGHPQPQTHGLPVPGHRRAILGIPDRQLAPVDARVRPDPRMERTLRMAEATQRHGTRIPRRIDSSTATSCLPYTAAYPDWWTDGFGSAARETAASRKTQSDLVAIEAMLSMAQMEGTGQSGGTHEELRRIHENLLFYDEHTFGAAESIWNPGCENSQVQWAEKGSYVWEALKSTQLLYEDAIGRLTRRPLPLDAPDAHVLQPARLGTLGTGDSLHRLRTDPGRPRVPDRRCKRESPARTAHPLAPRKDAITPSGRKESPPWATRHLRNRTRRRQGRRTPAARNSGTTASKTISTGSSSTRLRGRSPRSTTRSWDGRWSTRTRNGSWGLSSMNRSTATATRWNAKYSTITGALRSPTYTARALRRAIFTRASASRAKPRDATKNSACRSKYACITT